MLRLLENSFVSQIFTMLPSPRQNYSPAEGYYSYPPDTVFLKICFPQQNGGRKLWNIYKISSPTNPPKQTCDQKITLKFMLTPAEMFLTTSQKIKDQKSIEYMLRF